jgi:two-component system alkaline phosphatase synthesis response regulator PhoP
MDEHADLKLPELKCILIVDDEAENREILRDLLKDDGYEIVLAADGREGLRKATFGVNVILLDVSMPDLDGITVCRELKSHPETAGIPVLFLSACPEQEVQEAALKSGAYDFLHKPIHASELRIKVSAARQVDQHLAPGIRRACYEQLVREESAKHKDEEAMLDRQMDMACLQEF